MASEAELAPVLPHAPVGVPDVRPLGAGLPTPFLTLAGLRVVPAHPLVDRRLRGRIALPRRVVRPSTR